MPSAGDVERYAYCAHNWWLARRGVDPAGGGSERGIQEHKDKGKAIEAIRRSRSERRRALDWAFRGVLVLGSVLMLSLEVIYFDATPQGLILVVTALVLVSATVGLWVIAKYQERQEEEARRAAGIPKGGVVDSDLAGHGRLLRDEEWGLSGTPDYVLETERGLVPVEVKTGRTPERPYESHVLQVASYLRLIEVASQRAPAYGLLTYPDRIFQVDWDRAARDRLKDVLERMAAAEAAGRADRDHEHPGRCRGCARREACDQRLA